MTYSENYIASAGQTYVPFSENIHVKLPEFEPPAKPEPPLPKLTLTASASGADTHSGGGRQRICAAFTKTTFSSGSNGGYDGLVLG